MYHKIDTLADKPEEIVPMMKAHEVRLQQDVRACTPALGSIGKWYGIWLPTGASEFKCRCKW